MCTAGFGLCSRANTPAPELPLHAASGGSSAPPLSLSPAYPRCNHSWRLLTSLMNSSSPTILTRLASGMNLQSPPLR